MNDNNRPVPASLEGKKTVGKISAAAEPKMKKSHHSILVPIKADKTARRSDEGRSDAQQREHWSQWLLPKMGYFGTVDGAGHTSPISNWFRSIDAPYCPQQASAYQGTQALRETRPTQRCYMRKDAKDDHIIETAENAMPPVESLSYFRSQIF